MRTITQLTIAATLALAMAFTLNACSSSDDEGGSSGGGGGSLESLLANNPYYQQMKKELEYYDPGNSEERCKAGVVERICENDEWYNPLKQRCGYDGSSHKVGTREACGDIVYSKYPSGNYDDKCENNVYLERCGDKWYNRETHSCTGNSVEKSDLQFCGGKSFSTDYEKCDNGVIKYECGVRGTDTTWYNEDTEYCDKDYYTVKPLPKCDGKFMGGEGIRDGVERCATDGKTLERRCDMYDEESPWYNPITQACSYNDGSYTLKNKIKCSK